MIGGDGINDESNKTAPAPTRNTDLTKNIAVLAYGGFHITGPVKRADHLARDMANRRLTHGKLLRSNQMGQDEHNPER